jgi:hypothetical protein
MELEKEKENQDNLKNIVCHKGNMLLDQYVSPENNIKTYSLKFTLDKLNPEKVNVKSLLEPSIYELLEKINPDLIEKIAILNIISECENDVAILLKPIAREIGIKQKYILFRTSRTIDFYNNTVTFINNDISQIDKALHQEYLTYLNIDNNKYEPMIFNYGKTVIAITNLYKNSLKELFYRETQYQHQNLNQNKDLSLDIDFNIDFQLLIKDSLPIYMENIVGLMFKKLFYNLKQFINNLNA